MELTMVERLILFNQMKILEILNPDDAKYYARHSKALLEGYQIHYSDIIYGFSDGLSEEQSRFVLDVIEMYDFLQRGFNALDDKEGIDESSIVFRGFDGNNESNYLGYLRYVMKDLNRYDYLRTADDLNSHWPTVDKYENMLESWNKSADKMNLTKDDITRITSRE